jgi:hypothetical protein
MGIIERIEDERTVRLSVGMKHGVTAGMHFDVLGQSGRTSVQLEVATVAETSSQAKVLGDGTRWHGAIVLAEIPVASTTSTQPTEVNSPSRRPGGGAWKRDADSFSGLGTGIAPSNLRKEDADAMNR